MTTCSAPSSRLLEGTALVLGAFLLFLVQPMIARSILPWFGGAAAVWVTCLVFFQVALFLGYLYAHVLTRLLPPRGQASVHGALLVVALATLPVNPSVDWKPAGGGDPSLRIIGLLAVSLGLPYVLLAATAPLVQAWAARARADRLPWRLFAVSNAGSLAALLGYPLAVEPILGVATQMHAWSAAFGAFALVAGAVAWKAGRDAPDPRPPPAPAPRAPRGDRIHALLLAACASVLLTSVSAHLTQNVAGVPFLWVVPLAIYLLTFILCFEGGAWYRRSRFVPLLFLSLWGMTALLGPDAESCTLWIVVPVFAVGLFVCCMVCHGELALLRPDPSRLTAFYLDVAAGGALGGLLVGLVAPRLFNGLWELPLGLAACLVLALASARRRPPDHIPAAMFRSAWAAASLAACASVGVLGCQGARLHFRQRLMARDFYGGLRVTDRVSPSGEGDARILMHGVINHGEQLLDPARRREATSYFAPNSGAALALTRLPRPTHQRVGVVGLGAGTLAAFSRAGDTYRFYEISPLVARLARTHFTYLSDSPAHVHVVLGDGRLSLEREPDQQFDVLLLDAFSGDAIPTHLLTREAFALWRRHLAPGGLLAVQITNRYLDIAPVVAQGAAQLGMGALRVEALPVKGSPWKGSTWVIVGEALGGIVVEKGDTGTDLFADPKRRAWTDDYSNPLGVLK